MSSGPYRNGPVQSLADRDQGHRPRPMMTQAEFALTGWKKEHNHMSLLSDDQNGSTGVLTGHGQG